MKYIYFHIDEFNRDAITASVLKKEFKDRGWVTIYGNRITSRLLKHFEWVFDVVVLPKPTFINAIFGRDKVSSLKSKYVMLYTENIGIIANDNFPKMVLKGALDEEFMSGMTCFVEKVSAFCFWGAQVSEIVKKTYKNIANKCHVVGHPRHDFRALINFEGKRKKIGIISRYCTLNDYYERHPIETIFDRYVKKHQYEYYNKKTMDFLEWERRGASPDQDLYLEAIDIKNTVLIIIRLNEAGYRVSFKIHPRERVSTWIDVFKRHNLNVDVVNSEIPFTHWATQQHCVIGSPSTSFYDCLMVGVKPISISALDSQRGNFVSRMYEENNKLTPYVDSPSTIDELLLLVQESTSELNVLNAGACEVLKAEANYPDCKESGAKIADVVNDVLKSSKQRTVTMSLGICIYRILNFILNIKIFISRWRGRSAVNSASFLLMPSVVTSIDKMATK